LTVDGWLDLGIGNMGQVLLSLVLDDGSWRRQAWRRRVRSLVSLAKATIGLELSPGGLVAAIALITAAGDGRRKELLEWTELELQAMGELSQADLFHIAALGLSTAEPDRVFHSPVWYRPFDPAPLALLDAAALADEEAFGDGPLDGRALA
jgi:hypothetical protein